MRFISRWCKRLMYWWRLKQLKKPFPNPILYYVTTTEDTRIVYLNYDAALAQTRATPNDAYFVTMKNVPPKLYYTLKVRNALGQQVHQILIGGPCKTHSQ